MLQSHPHRVAVYGTLKRHGSNHYLLRNARWLGRDRLSGFTLYHLGAYPGAKRKRQSTIEVEIYQVDRQQLARLDRLEAFHPRQPHRCEYLRESVSTRFGRAWLYLYNRPVKPVQRLPSGRW
jgi:gamma-glutamylcyclotransferase (GGCT)/AIG2-like uncharacterized protein YtfP